MKYHTKDVPPFQLTYRVFNKTDRDFEGGVFESVRAAYAYAANLPRHPQTPRISFTLKLESPVSYRVPGGYNYAATKAEGGLYWFRSYYRYDIREHAPPSPYVIVDSLGQALDKKAWEDGLASDYVYRPRGCDRWERRVAQKRSLVYRKGSAKKLKASYAYVESPRDGDPNNVTPLLGHGYHRAVRTTQEVRMAVAHADEYGLELVRPRRNRANLRTLWDDPSSGVYSTQRSWKHNSKRRKQWLPK